MNLGFCYLKFYLFRFGEFLKNSVSDKDEEPMLDVKSDVFNECSSSFWSTSILNCSSEELSLLIPNWLKNLLSGDI